MPALALYFFTLSAIRVPKQTRDKSNNTHMVESGMITSFDLVIGFDKGDDRLPGRLAHKPRLVSLVKLTVATWASYAAYNQYVPTTTIH